MLLARKAACRSGVTTRGLQLLGASSAGSPSSSPPTHRGHALPGPTAPADGGARRKYAPLALPLAAPDGGSLLPRVSLSQAVRAGAALTAARAGPMPPPPLLALDASLAYPRDRPLADLLRAWLVYRACASTDLVSHAGELLERAYSIAGPTLVDPLLRATVAGQFLAGESVDEAARTAGRLRRAHNVGAILDYCAEASPEAPRATLTDLNGTTLMQSGRDRTVSAPPAAGARCGRAWAALVDGQAASGGGLSEAGAEQHADAILRSIEAAAATHAHSDGASPDASAAPRSQLPSFVALKVSALCDPALLRAVTAAVQAEPEAAAAIRAGQPPSRSALEAVEESLGAAAGPAGAAAHRWAAAVARLERVAAAAAARGVPLLIDAEQSWYQCAIDALTAHLQRLHNTAGAGGAASRGLARVYGTHQAYLRDSPRRLAAYLEAADDPEHGFLPALKLVRGAYLDSERAHAAEMGFPSPVQPTLAATHAAFDGAAAALIRRAAAGGGAALIATHNESSVRAALEAMQAAGLLGPRAGPAATSGAAGAAGAPAGAFASPPPVAFAQLCGMKDGLTFGLAAAGAAVYKYLPFGALHEALPYLLRRVAENSAVLGPAAQEELPAVRAALAARLPLVGPALARRPGARALAA